MGTKKTNAPFLAINGKNTLGPKPKDKQPNANSRPKAKNALGLARRLCEMANRGAALGLSRGEARALRRHGGGSEAGELDRLASQMEVLVEASDCNTTFLLDESQMFSARIDPGTGQVRRRPIAPLGENQDIFQRVIAHPEIDKRRFARCANCQDFYYQPRLKSRTCGPKCDSALRQREHYWLEVGRREIACRLRSENKSVTEIARTLGVKPERVRQYLAGGKTNGKEA